MELVVASIVTLVVGAVSAYIMLRANLRTKVAVANERVQNLERRLAEAQAVCEKVAVDLVAKDATLRSASNDLSAVRAELAKEKEASAEKLALVQQSEQRLSESFDLLAAKAERVGVIARVRKLAVGAAQLWNTRDEAA